LPVTGFIVAVVGLNESNLIVSIFVIIIIIIIIIIALILNNFCVYDA